MALLARLQCPYTVPYIIVMAYIVMAYIVMAHNYVDHNHAGHTYASSVPCGAATDATAECDPLPSSCVHATVVDDVHAVVAQRPVSRPSAVLGVASPPSLVHRR